MVLAAISTAPSATPARSPARAPCIATSHESRRSTGSPTRGGAHGSKSLFRAFGLLFTGLTCPCRWATRSSGGMHSPRRFNVVRQAFVEREHSS